MKKSAIILAIMVLSSLSSFAASLLNVRGELFTVTESEYLIQTERNTYYIKGEKLTLEDKEKMKKPGDQVSLYVPVEAISKVVSRDSTKRN